MCQVELELGDHCIEGAARHKYHSLVQKVIKDEVDNIDYIEKVIDLLGDFLQSVDFAKLRSKYEDLDGRYSLKVILQRHGCVFLISYNDKVVEVKGEVADRDIK